MTRFKLKRFSKRYSSYRVWRRGKKLNRYSQKIIRLHKQFPGKTLPELRIMKLSAADLSRLAWGVMTTEQKSLRLFALEGLRALRAGKSLLDVLAKIQISRQDLFIHLGKFLYKYRGRWLARKTDTIQRQMKIYTKGRIKSIIVTNSSDASLLGDYFNAVQDFLGTRDPRHLQPFRWKFIVDAKGKKHPLETNPETIFRIDQMRERTYGYEIYDDR